MATHQPLAAVVDKDKHNVAHGAQQALDQWIAAGADLFLGGHIHLPYCIAVRTGDLRQSAVLLQAGTCLSHRVRNGTPNSYNHITLQRHGTERRMSIERRDYAWGIGPVRDGAAARGDESDGRHRTRLNGWRVVSRDTA